MSYPHTRHDERTAWAAAVLAAKLPEADDGGPQYIHPDLAEEYAAQVLREQPPWLGASRRRRVPNDHLTILTQAFTKAGKFKKVREYVDLGTGEIIPAEGLSLPVRKVGEHIEARAKIMRSMRSEVRRFAEFVLYFANRRRGTTPGIDTLARWYAELYDQKPEHVRRYVPRLKDAKVLVDETLLGSAFQRTAGGLRSERGPDESLRQYKLMRDLMPPIPTARREAAGC